MKSQAKRIRVDRLIFQWDHAASRSSSIKRNDSTDKQLSLDEYFDLLTEVKPHERELKYTKTEVPPKKQAQILHNLLIFK